MNADEHGFSDQVFSTEGTQGPTFALSWSNWLRHAGTDWLLENCAAFAAHGAGRVGRRVAPESAAAAFSDRNDGQQLFFAPADIRVYSRSSAVKNGSNQGSGSISANKCSSVVKSGSTLHSLRPPC